MTPLKLTASVLDSLLGAHGEHLVSVYIPTATKGPEIDQGRIRLKNQLARLDAALGEEGWKPKRRQKHLRSAHSLLEDAEFWQHQSSGLGVFIDSTGEVSPVALLETVETITTVAPDYLIRPLLSTLEVEELNVLMLTRNAVALYVSSRFETYRLQADLPKSMDDVNWFVDREKRRQQHADAAGSMRSRHGHDPAERRHEDLKRFLREVAKALADRPLTRSEPLVVLGDDSLVEQFGDIYDATTRSPEHSGIRAVDDPAEVRELAKPILIEYEQSRRDEATKRALTALAVEEAIVDLPLALEHAVSGRISEIVINRDATPRWGEFDPASFNTTGHAAWRVGSADLLDRLVCHAITTGAGVTTTSGQIGGHDFVAALRF